LEAVNKKLGATCEEAFVPPSVLQSYAVFWVEDIHTDSLTYELGLRIEHQQIDAEGYARKQHTPVSASLSALWHINEELFMSLAFTHAQRAPSVQELFADGVHFASQNYALGNADLQIETSYNLEFSFKADFDWINTELNAFHNWGHNYINQHNTGTWFNLDSEDFSSNCSANCLPVYQVTQDKVRFYGFEAQVGFPLWEEANHQFDISLFSDYVRGELSSGSNVPRMPPLRYGFQLNYTGYQSYTAGLRLTRAEAQHHTGINESRTPGYLLLNMHINYKVNVADSVDTLLFVKANNLLNATIRNATSYLKEVAPEPGRGVEVGIRVSF
jgi:iron complex outermembrane receptor protein